MEPRITPPRVALNPPMQVRIFRDRDLEALESALNRWLAERKDREIVDMRQSLAPAEKGGELIVSIWYVEG
jgi:hypothetical protein